MDVATNKSVILVKGSSPSVYPLDLKANKQCIHCARYSASIYFASQSYKILNYQKAIYDETRIKSETMIEKEVGTPGTKHSRLNVLLCF